MYKVILLLTLTLNACVPAKTVSEITENYEKSEVMRNALSTVNDSLEKLSIEQTTELASLNKKYIKLEQDTMRLTSEIAHINHKYEGLHKSNIDLIENNEITRTGSQAENRQLLDKLFKTQELLQDKEDSLRLLAYDIDVQTGKLNTLNGDLKLREDRVNELEAILAKKEKAVMQLRNQIKEALEDFENRGITVEERKGRVYISMDAKFLFKSGSSTVGRDGKSAITKLAKALEGREKLTIMVEGHTDSDKMSGKGVYLDNWELSTQRATSVVRIMISNSKLDPFILTAAGRGEFNPISQNDTPQNKAQNRRIEVILTTSHDMLFEIIEGGNTKKSKEETNTKKQKVNTHM